MLKIFIVAFFFMIIQAGLTYYQSKKIQMKMVEVRKHGDFGIGQTRGRLRPGNILVLAVDETDHIVEVQLMRGISFFAQFKSFSALTGKTIGEVDRIMADKKIHDDVKKSVTMAIQQIELQRRKRGERELESLTDFQ
jgi:DNA-binding transcriptional regulator of glucitol operon